MGKVARASVDIVKVPVDKRDGRGRFVKGIRPSGRPKTALAELCRQAVSKHELVNVLANIGSRNKPYWNSLKKDGVTLTVADQINAIRLLLTYGYGVPKGEQDTGPVKIEVVYADNRHVTLNQVNGLAKHLPEPIEA